MSRSLLMEHRGITLCSAQLKSLASPIQARFDHRLLDRPPDDLAYAGALPGSIPLLFYTAKNETPFRMSRFLLMEHRGIEDRKTLKLRRLDHTASSCSQKSSQKSMVNCNNIYDLMIACRISPLFPFVKSLSLYDLIR